MGTSSAEKPATSQNSASQGHTGEQVAGFSALADEEVPF